MAFRMAYHWRATFPFSHRIEIRQVVAEPKQKQRRRQTVDA